MDNYKFSDTESLAPSLQKSITEGLVKKTIKSGLFSSSSSNSEASFDNVIPRNLDKALKRHSVNKLAQKASSSMKKNLASKSIKAPKKTQNKKGCISKEDLVRINFCL